MKGQSHRASGRGKNLLLAVHRKEYFTVQVRYTFVYGFKYCNTWVGYTSRNVSETCVQLNKVLVALQSSSRPVSLQVTLLIGSNEVQQYLFQLDL